MTMTDTQALATWRGRDVLDRSGQKIGRLAEIYVDDESGTPAWIAIRTGLFGSRSSFAPLAGAEPQGDAVMVPWDKDTVKDAPNVDDDGHLEPDEEASLYRYYDMGDGRGTQVAQSDQGDDTSGPNTDDAMTRSEEELRVGKMTQESGRVRLRKWVETEHVTTTVPVAHDEVRIEREPITEANIGKAMDGPEISEEEHEVILTEERAVAATETVPKERVKLVKETVEGEQEVSADLRKERIESDGVAATEPQAGSPRR